MAEDRALPGWPKKKLVKEVRRHLRSYGIRPTSIKLWHETWAWASRITQSYVYPRWPLPSEIAAQFVVVLLLEMSTYRHLKLPFRATQHLPPSLQHKIEGTPLPLLELKSREDEAHVATPAKHGE